MNFLKQHKKVFSIIFIILSMFFLLSYFIESIYIYEKHKEDHTVVNVDMNGEKEIILGNRKKVKISKIPALNPIKLEIDDMENEITRENYKDGMMVIGIPKIKVRAAVINGTSKEALKRGPGLYEKSPLPSENECNVCIAAHRNAYGQWFRNIDKLKKGDEIYLELSKIKYIYEVIEVFIVEKNDWSVTQLTGYDAITLTSCHPLKPPYKRIIARGKLIEIINNKY